MWDLPYYWDFRLCFHMHDLIRSPLRGNFVGCVWRGETSSVSCVWWQGRAHPLGAQLADVGVYARAPARCFHLREKSALRYAIAARLGGFRPTGSSKILRDLVRGVDAQRSPNVGRDLFFDFCALA